jgi:hypothetical protein
MWRGLAGMLLILNVGIAAAQDTARLRVAVRSEDRPVLDADVVVNGVTQKTDALGSTVFVVPATSRSSW